jgi:hypothetical protein
MDRISLSLAAIALTACTSTYHPEYHPVTTTTITTQTYGSPAQAGPHAGAAPQGVVVVPAPGQPVIVQSAPAASPEAFFDTSYR